MNVADLARAVVSRKREKGLHVRRVRNYETTAERLVSRYERHAGGLEYDRDVLAETILECREDMECGRMAKSTFKMARRIAADIEDMADYGDIGRDNLPAWGKRRNPLNRPVSDEAKLDRGSIVGLASEVLSLMDEKGYSPNTMSTYKHVALPRLIRHFDLVGAEGYSDEVIDSYLEGLRKPEGEWDYAKYAYARGAALHVRSVHDSGALHEPTFDGCAIRAMAGPFAGLLDEFKSWEVAEGLEASTVDRYGESVARFLEELRAQGLEDLSSLTRAAVRAARRAVEPGKKPEYMSSMLSALRAFSRFVESSRPEIPPFAGWLGRPPKRRRRMPLEGYSREQAEAIASSIDVSKKAGHRDRAIVVLAKNTGLRGVDIRNLRVSDIDWRANKITIVQSKTGRVLALPLDRESGEAIASYILESRRSGGGDTIFLTAVGPVGPVTKDRLRAIVRKHAVPVVGPGYGGPHGTHAFRRGLGKAMVEAGVPLSDAAEVLGHASVKSADPYVAVAKECLRICAAGLEEAPTGGISWLN